MIHRDRAARRGLRAEIKEVFLRRPDGLFESEHGDAVAGDLAQAVSENAPVIAAFKVGVHVDEEIAVSVLVKMVSVVRRLADDGGGEGAHR